MSTVLLFRKRNVATFYLGSVNRKCWLLVGRNGLEIKRSHQARNGIKNTEQNTTHREKKKNKILLRG
jgi:hypothetical protein